MKSGAYFFLMLALFLLAACGSSGGARYAPGAAAYPAATPYYDGADGANVRTPSNFTKTQPDPNPARRIVMLYPADGERLDVVYFHDGHYDAKAMRRIDHLFRDRHAHVTGKIDPELIDYLVDIRTRFNLPPSVTFEILNGYRTKATNARMARHNKNVAIESLHMYGWAVDFRIPGVDGRAICEVAKTMQRGGVAYYPKSNHVHIDLGNIRTWREK